MMKFESFVNEVASRIEELTTGYKFSVQTCRKLNVETLGIIITKKGCNVSPELYLDDSYKAYVAGDLDISNYVSDLIEQLPKILDESPVNEIYDNIHDNIFDYNWVKGHLYIALSSAKKNWRLLDETPHTIIEDLILTVHIFLSCGEGVARTIMVKNEMLNYWRIDENTLFKDAMKSSPTINPIKTFSLVGTSMPMTYVTCRLTCRDMLVGSAAGIFYPGVFEQIAEKMNGSYYILPSSVFEVLVIPDDGNFKPEALSTMVVEINASKVKDSEVLSDHAYYYDAIKHEFCSV